MTKTCKRSAAALLELTLALSLLACGSSDGRSHDGGLARDGASDGAAGDGDGDGDSVARGDAGDGDGDLDGAPSGDGDGDGDVRDGEDAAADAGEIAPADASTDATAEPDAMLPALEDLPYAREVVTYEEGASAGFGQDEYPDIVFGPPKGKGSGSGSLDVLSLGVGGSIVIGFGAGAIVDGDGPDFIVFENVFIGGGQLFMELGEVSVSDDGVTWHTFPCDEAGDGDDRFPGCAGWTPTLRFDPQLVVPLDPALTGGDAFDLAELGVTSARYVRIQDLGTKPGSANTGGFDLDAIGIVHAQ